MNNPYHRLGLPDHAAKPQIRQRFRELAKQYHPDHHPGDPISEERFKEIAASYAMLMGKVEAISPSQRSAVKWDHGFIWALWTCSPVRAWGRIWAEYLKIIATR